MFSFLPSKPDIRLEFQMSPAKGGRGGPLSGFRPKHANPGLGRPVPPFSPVLGVCHSPKPNPTRGHVFCVKQTGSLTSSSPGPIWSETPFGNLKKEVKKKSVTDCIFNRQCLVRLSGIQDPCLLQVAQYNGETVMGRLLSSAFCLKMLLLCWACASESAPRGVSTQKVPLDTRPWRCQASRGGTEALPWRLWAAHPQMPSVNPSAHGFLCQRMCVFLRVPCPRCFFS